MIYKSFYANLIHALFFIPLKLKASRVNTPSSYKHKADLLAMIIIQMLRDWADQVFCTYLLYLQLVKLSWDIFKVIFFNTPMKSCLRVKQDFFVSKHYLLGDNFLHDFFPLCSCLCWPFIWTLSFHLHLSQSTTSNGLYFFSNFLFDFKEESSSPLPFGLTVTLQLLVNWSALPYFRVEEAYKWKEYSIFLTVVPVLNVGFTWSRPSIMNEWRTGFYSPFLVGSYIFKNELSFSNDS